MQRRFWKRLAGCIVIKCLLAATPEYQAGTAAAGTVRAVVLQDRHGNRVLMAQGTPPVTRSIADFVAARFVRDLQVDRAALLLAGGSADDLIGALDAALLHIEPATVVFNGSRISISVGGQCRATLFPIAFEGCTPGTTVRAPIRAVFQMIDLAHNLQKRGDTPPVWPVQAIALGRQVTILAVGGDVTADRRPDQIIVPFANDSSTPQPDPRIATAIRQILARIGR